MDDDSGVRKLMVDALTYCVNREVLAFETYDLAWQYFQDGNHADLVICDVDMANKSGFELMAKIKHQSPDKIFIVMSGQTEHEQKAERSGADAFLGKPFGINDLFNLVQTYIVD